MTERYLTDDEMNELLLKAQSLRKGFKLHPDAKAPYVVIVDEDYVWLKTIASLKKFLSSCFVPPNYEIFRNRDKGVTINLDV